MKATYNIALALVIVGALNWGLIGALDFNLVAAIFGESSALSRIIYTLVGLSAVAVAAQAVAPSKVGDPIAQH